MLNSRKKDTIVFGDDKLPISYVIDIGLWHSNLTLSMRNEVFLKMFNEIYDINSFSNILYALTGHRFMLIHMSLHDEHELSHLEFQVNMTTAYEFGNDDVIKLLDDICIAKVQYDLKTEIEC